MKSNIHKYNFQFLINYIEKLCTKYPVFPDANQETDSNYREQTDGYQRGGGCGDGLNR